MNNFNSNSNRPTMIEVFTTNIRNKVHAERILKILENNFSELRINFDLDDSESPRPCSQTILRVEGVTVHSEDIISMVNKSGFTCNILEDKICK